MNDNPRIALVGMILESNAFAPPVDAKSFNDFLFLSGDALLEEVRRVNGKAPRELTSFVSCMDVTGDWTPIPLTVCASPPGGPVDDDFYQSVIRQVEDALTNTPDLDGVYIANHGAMTTTKRADGDGEFVSRIRQAVGTDTRIIMTLDLHANLSDTMVDNTDCIIGYLTNPHVDQIARGEEAALTMRQCLGEKVSPQSFLLRLPLTPPSVTLLTASGPYADVIEFGQRRCRESGGQILNVSVFGGFVFSDSNKNGFSIVVTARSGMSHAKHLALEIAEYAWSIRHAFNRQLTSIPDAIDQIQTNAENPQLPALIFSDAGDNPGGGGSGAATELLEAMVNAGVSRVMYGSFYEPGIAKAAATAGVGASLDVTFNRYAPKGTGNSVTTAARVIAVHDEDIVGRRGIYQQRRLSLSPMAALEIGDGLIVIVISQRVQTADPVMFECLGLDISDARVVIVKSRGHFRAGFDEYFSKEQVFEIDTAGYTSPVLERFSWQGLPRPVFPLDPETTWSANAIKTSL